MKIDLSWLSLPVGLPLTRDRHNGCRAHDADDRLPGNPCDRRVELLRVRTRGRVYGFSRARRNCGPAYMTQGFSHSHLFGARRHDHRASGASARHEDSPDDRRASPMYVHRLRHAHESALRESYDRSISSAEWELSKLFWRKKALTNHSLSLGAASPENGATFSDRNCSVRRNRLGGASVYV